MRAMLLTKICQLEATAEPLSLANVPRPIPGSGEILLRVSACGVCHTELDEIEGRAAPPALPVIPGHEVVGVVAETGANCTLHAVGDRVGVGWIYSSDGSDKENISEEFRATGRDVNGGYAEYTTVPECYAYAVPDEFSDVEAAPLLCAGGVGYRVFRLARLSDGETLGLTGFGGSGHLVLQLSKHLYPASSVFVFARSERERQFARELGADWAGDSLALPPEPPHAIIDTTPVWSTVIAALECLRAGGRLVINAIRKEDGDKHRLSEIRYEKHLWLEKEIKTVANVTHSDIAEFLPVAAAIPLHVETQSYPLEKANEALQDLRRGHIRGAKVLTIQSPACGS
jgi:propanol-preferring alcohol dehydrogenase